MIWINSPPAPFNVHMSFCLHVCRYTMYVPCTWGGQQRVMGPLSWSYRRFLAMIWVLGTKTRTSRRAASTLWVAMPSLHSPVWINSWEREQWICFLPERCQLDSNHRNFQVAYNVMSPPSTWLYITQISFFGPAISLNTQAPHQVTLILCVLCKHTYDMFICVHMLGGGSTNSNSKIWTMQI